MAELFQEVKLRFIDQLPDDEVDLLSQSTSAEDFLTEVANLERSHCDKSLTRKLLDRCNKFVQGIEQYGKAIDVISNAAPETLGLLWGSTRIIIHLVRNFNQLFEKIVDMLQSVGKQLGLFDLFAKLYPSSSRLKTSMVDAYEAFLDFCWTLIKMLKHTQKSRNLWILSDSIRLMIKSAFKPIKADFEALCTRLDRLMNDVRIEADTAEKQASHQHRIKVEQRVDFEKQRELFEWLDAIDTTSTLTSLSEIHQKDTGDWIFQNEQFHRWETTPSSTLWVNAKPGAGKTMLAFAVIEHLKLSLKSDETLLYYFCDYKEAKSQTQRSLLQTLLSDIAQDNNEAMELLEARTSRYRKLNFKCSSAQLLEILSDLLRLSRKVYLVIDALDECVERTDMISTLLRLSKKHAALSLLMTSRDEADIRSLLQSVEQISLTSATMADDIELYVSHNVMDMLKSGKLKVRNHQLTNEIINKLCDKADGMFQWVKYQLDAICHCISDRAILTALSDLPSGLDETYLRIFRTLRRKFPGHIRLIRLLYSWILHSMRPLTLEELAAVIAVDLENGTIDYEAIPTEPNDLLRFSGGLFRISESDGRILLAHFSVKEFMISDRMKVSSAQDFYVSPDDADYDIFRTCLICLTFPKYSNGICKTWQQLDRRLTDQPLLYYASIYCWWHANNAETAFETVIEACVRKLLLSSDGIENLVSWRQIWWSYYQAGLSRDSLQFHSLVFDYPEQQPGFIYANPLNYAAEAWNKPLTNFLLMSGCEIENAEEDDSPLLTATLRRRPELQPKGALDWQYIRNLIHLGANLHRRSQKGNVAYAIVRFGSPEEWKMIPKMGSDSKDLEIESDLNLTASTLLGALVSHPSDPADFLKYVVDLGLDVDEKYVFQAHSSREYIRSDMPYGPALQMAIQHRNHRCTDLLIHAGADINFADCGLGSPLQAAARKGDLTMVRKLLALGANPNSTGGVLGSPLQAASWSGNIAVVRLLLESNADANVAGGFFGDALTVGILQHHSGIPALLLDHGSSVKGHLPYYEHSWLGLLPPFQRLGGDIEPAVHTPLSAALTTYDTSLASRLIDLGAPLDEPLERCDIAGTWALPSRQNDYRHFHPLCVAIMRQNVAAIKMLLERSVDVSIGDCCAIITSCELELLDELGLFMERLPASYDAQRLLAEALCVSHDESIIKYVIKQIEKSYADGDATLLRIIWRSENVSSLVCRWLLSKNIVPETNFNIERRTEKLGSSNLRPTNPLLRAIERQQHEIVEMLVDAGLCMDPSDDVGLSAIDRAILNQDEHLIARLLNAGMDPARQRKLHGRCACMLHDARSSESIELLLRYGADVNAKCLFCPTTLWRVLRREEYQCVESLIGSGCDVNAYNLDGLTPLDYALKHGLLDIADLLRRHGGITTTDVTKQQVLRTNVETLVNHILGVHSAESDWKDMNAWDALGSCLLRLGDDENCVVAMEALCYRSADGFTKTYQPCRSCDEDEGEFHKCEERSFGLCLPKCVRIHNKLVSARSKTDSHRFAHYPRPFFDAHGPGTIAISEEQGLGRNEWLFMVREKWSPGNAA